MCLDCKCDTFGKKVVISLQLASNPIVLKGVNTWKLDNNVGSILTFNTSRGEGGREGGKINF